VGSEAVLQQRGLRAGEPELLPGAAVARAPAITVVLGLQRRPDSPLVVPTTTRNGSNAALCSLLPAPRRRRPRLPVINAAVAMVLLRRDQLAEQTHRRRRLLLRRRRHPAGLSHLKGQPRVELRRARLHAAAGSGEAGHGDRSIGESSGCTR
jgi:hypothetical protein